MRLPQKGASYQHLAAVGEERSVGRLLQSCSNRDAASHCGGDVLFGRGFLRCLLEMIEPDWTGKKTEWVQAGDELISVAMH